MNESISLTGQVKRGLTARAKSVSEEAIDFLKSNPKFEAVLRSTKESSSRLWLFYPGSYVEAFGNAAPCDRLSLNKSRPF